jgi:hypothetical protein
MHEPKSLEKRSIAFGLVGTLILLALTLGSGAQAANRMYQTIPTPTPRTIPAPTLEADLERAGEGATSAGPLQVRQELSPVDVLPDEELSLWLHVTNSSVDEVRGIILSDQLAPSLQALEVRATQGAARVQGQSVLVDVGTMEAGQTVVAIIRARVLPDVEPGEVIFNQATAYFDGGQAVSDIAAAALPPDELPATGQNRRLP